MQLNIQKYSLYFENWRFVYFFSQNAHLAFLRCEIVLFDSQASKRSGVKYYDVVIIYLINEERGCREHQYIDGAREKYPKAVD